MKKTKQTYARRCDECGKLMNEGFCIDGGGEYYCSDECLYKNMTPEEFDALYENGLGDSYWTIWEDEDDFQYYEDGTEIEDDEIVLTAQTKLK